MKNLFINDVYFFNILKIIENNKDIKNFPFEEIDEILNLFLKIF